MIRNVYAASANKLPRIDLALIGDTDPKRMGEEPTFPEGVEITQVQLGNALSWYGYFFDKSISKQFTIDYLVSVLEADDSYLETVKKIPEAYFWSIGWICRLLIRNVKVPKVSEDRAFAKLDSLVKNFGKTDMSRLPSIGREDEEEISNVIQVNFTPVKTKRKSLAIEGFEQALDEFYEKYTITFRPWEFINNNRFTKESVKEVIKFYSPLREEIIQASKGSVEGYKLTKRQYMVYIEFLDLILSDCQRYVGSAIVGRKPRRKKVKTASQLAAKTQIKIEDNEYKIKSINPADIVGAGSVWVFNTKTRILAHYIKRTDAGLTLRGNVIDNFDVEQSVSKRLRKPPEIINIVLNGGKVQLRKLMDTIKTTEIEPSGRLNTDCILLKATKNERTE